MPSSPPNMNIPLFVPTHHNKVYPSINPKSPDLSAKGKVVVITGGGSGIGQATALAFSTAEAKAIIVIGRREPNLQETVTAISDGVQARYFVGDATDAARIKEIFNAVKA